MFSFNLVIPAKAGISLGTFRANWAAIPAFAGMTRGDDQAEELTYIFG